MDRGIPTEEFLEQMRHAKPSVRYLVGTPKGRLTKLEKDLAAKGSIFSEATSPEKTLPSSGATT